MSAILRCAKAAAFAVLCVVSPAFAAERLAGHYYLNGVAEVGSELLLRDDGRFEWFLAYGAMDRTAFEHVGRAGVNGGAKGSQMAAA